MIFNPKNNLLFSTGNKVLCTHSELKPIDYKPNNQFNIDSDILIKSVQNSFDHIENKDKINPILVGAIPFDASAQASLYLAKDYQFYQKNEILNLIKNPSPPSVNDILSTQALFTEAEYKSAVSQAVQEIKKKKLSKVVLSQSRYIHLEKPFDIHSALVHLLYNNPHCYTYSVPIIDGGIFIGSSPELLISRHHNQVEFFPLAGTAPRSSNANQDKNNAENLLKSKKNRHEHQLVIDDIAEKLSPLVSALTVPKEPELVCTSKVWHLGTRIRGLLKQNLQSHILDLVSVFHPTPALCGTPKNKAVDFINKVEPFSRNYFSGAVGWSDEQGNGEWAVSIRCALVKENQLLLYAGAGIVEDSNPEEEWIETINKQKVILHSIKLDHQR